MREYIVFYYVEQNDDNTDLEITIHADNIGMALMKFQIQVKVYKRVYQIKELPKIK